MSDINRVPEFSFFRFWFWTNVLEMSTKIYKKKIILEFRINGYSAVSTNDGVIIFGGDTTGLSITVTIKLIDFLILLSYRE